MTGTDSPPPPPLRRELQQIAARANEERFREHLAAIEKQARQQAAAGHTELVYAVKVGSREVRSNTFFNEAIRPLIRAVESRGLDCHATHGYRNDPSGDPQRFLIDLSISWSEPA